MAIAVPTPQISRADLVWYDELAEIRTSRPLMSPAAIKAVCVVLDSLGKELDGSLATSARDLCDALNNYRPERGSTEKATRRVPKLRLA